MFHQMRRYKQAIGKEECEEILHQGSFGTLALSGNEEYPYAVPISYIYMDQKLYFHCAKTGHKLDLIKQNSKASFCVVGCDQVVPEEFTTYFSSVIVFGSITILNDEERKYQVIEKLSLKYGPENTLESVQQEIERHREKFDILEMSVDHMNGKKARELMKESHS